MVSTSPLQVKLWQCFVLATSLSDLKTRLGNMLVAYNTKNEPIYVKDLGIEGALAMVLKDAIKPNMVQTLEHNPVLIHGGTICELIAHGCNSILATKTCLKLADYTVTEAGLEQIWALKNS